MSNLHTQIVRLAKKRVPPTQIAKLARCSKDKVYSEIRKARTRGEDIPYFRAMDKQNDRPGSSIALPARLHKLLTRYAEAREMTKGEAVASLLEDSLLSKVELLDGGTDA